MKELTQFNWQAFDPAPGIKVVIGLLVMLVLTSATGQPWVATSLVVFFAWLTDIPGPLKDRIGGMVAFGVIAIAITYISGRLDSLALWPSALMFFLTALMVLSWHSLEADQFNLTLGELVSGKILGVVIAIAAVLFLQRWQTRSSPKLQQARSG
jgi:hypothetical protein